jgi:hypothetical protein
MMNKLRPMPKKKRWSKKMCYEKDKIIIVTLSDGNNIMNS